MVQNSSYNDLWICKKLCRGSWTGLLLNMVSQSRCGSLTTHEPPIAHRTQFRNHWYKLLFQWEVLGGTAYSSSVLLLIFEVYGTSYHVPCSEDSYLSLICNDFCFSSLQLHGRLTTIGEVKWLGTLRFVWMANLQNQILQVKECLWN